MLVAAPAGSSTGGSATCPTALHPGDLLVVNTSATLPAAVDLLDDDRFLHVSTQLDDGDWVVEVRRADNTGPSATTTGALLRLPGGVDLRVARPAPRGTAPALAGDPGPATDRTAYLTGHGRPVRYPYVDGDWPLAALAERLRRGRPAAPRCRAPADRSPTGCWCG